MAYTAAAAKTNHQDDRVKLAVSGVVRCYLWDFDTTRIFLSSSAPAVLFDPPWVLFYLALIYLFHPLLAGLSGAQS